jgi:hypothetical protein
MQIIYDDGPVQPKHVMNLHAHMDNKVIQPIICGHRYMGGGSPHFLSLH